MKLEQQVCNLDLAKQLKELGVKQIGFFYHAYDTYTKTSEIYYNAKNGLPCECKKDTTGYLYYSAFTVAELGELIGNMCNEWSQGWNDSGCFWQFQYGNKGCGNMIEGIGDRFCAEENTEADARAKTLIYILEQGIITTNDLYKPTHKNKKNMGQS